MTIFELPKSSQNMDKLPFLTAFLSGTFTFLAQCAKGIPDAQWDNKWLNAGFAYKFRAWLQILKPAFLEILNGSKECRSFE